jgi:hypothetical protein
MVANPKPIDEEECIYVERGVTYEKMMQLVDNGEINVASSYTILMGVRKLEELGYPLHF